MKTIFIISGPSGVGKTTLWNFLSKYKDELKIEKVITSTTRQKRENEINGIDYYFLTIDEFGKLIKEHKLVERAEVHNNFYGSTYYELERILKKGYRPLYIIDPQGAKYLKEKLSNKYNIITIFLQPPNLTELKRRLLKRGEKEDSESFKIRLNESIIWLQEAEDYDYKIVNDTIDKAVNKLKLIFKNYK